MGNYDVSNPNWPTSFGTCTIVGKFLDKDGQPYTGKKVIFQSDCKVIHNITGNTLVFSGPITTTVQPDGTISLPIPATDDPDNLPHTFTYKVTYEWGPDVGIKPFHIAAPLGTTVDLTDVFPVNFDSGRISAEDIAAMISGVVKYDTLQSLTEAQQDQARDNVFAERRRFFNVHDYGTAVGTGSDDAAAISAAITAATPTKGAVVFGSLDYICNSAVVVPEGVRLIGTGGHAAGLNAPGTRIIMNNAAANFKFQGGGCGASGILFDGLGVANNPVQIGGSVAGDIGAYPFFQDVCVARGAQVNWKMYGSQNGVLHHCSSLQGVKGVQVDYGFGGWLFSRFEVDSPSDVGLEFLNTGAGTLFPNTFIQCIFERRSTDGPMVSNIASNLQHFYHCTFSTQQVTATTAVINNYSQGYLSLDGCNFALQNNQAAVATKGVPNTTNPTTRFSGSTQVSGSGNLYLNDIDNQGFVTMEAWAINTVSGTGFVKTASGPDSNVAQYQTTGRTVLRRASTDIDFQSYVSGNTQPYNKKDVAGKQSWGPGGSTATDTDLARTNVGELTVTNTLKASTALSAPAVTGTTSVTGATVTGTTAVVGGTVSGTAITASTSVSTPVVKGTNVVTTGVNYNLATTDAVVIPTAAGLTIQLPNAATATGQEFKILANNFPCTVTSAGGTIDGVSSVALRGTGVYISDGTNWIDMNKTGACDVQIFNTAGAGTWTKPPKIGKQVFVQCWGAGGGGGAGSRQASGTASCGGGSGGGGGYTSRRINYTDISTSTVAVTVGTKGTGGAAQNTDNSAGANGTAGTATFFGAAGTTWFANANGGGLGGGGGAGVAGSAGAAGSGFDGLGSAGVTSSAAGAAGTIGNSSFLGSPGGGSGGGIATTPANTAGGAGGAHGGSSATGGSAGTSGGGNGGNGNAFPSTNYGNGTGGGGGGSNTAGAGGAGGNGATGAGGGGGGASLNGNNSGKGGDGGDGLLIVTTYF